MKEKLIEQTHVDGGIQEKNLFTIDYADRLILEKKYDEAGTLLLDLSRVDPNNKRIFNSYGLVCWYKDRINEAFKFFSKALALDPTYEDCLINYFDTGLKLEKANDIRIALTKALEMEPDLSDVRQCLVKLEKELQKDGKVDFNRVVAHRELLVMGEKLITEGLFDNAKETFNIILSEDKTYHEAWNNLGLVDYSMGDYEKAYVSFMKCYSLEPSFVDCIINMFDVSITLKELDRFTKILKEAIAYNSDCIELKTLLSEIEEQGNSIYKTDRLTKEEKINILIHEADNLVISKDPQKALDKYMGVLALKEFEHRALNGLSVLCYNNRDYLDSYKLLKKANEISPINEMILMNYYEAALKVGKTDEVIIKMRQAIDIDPTLLETKEFLDDCDKQAS